MSVTVHDKLLGVKGYQKRPTLVIYWADTQELLTHRERLFISGDAIVVDVTPLEVLLKDKHSGRNVVVRGITDDHLPPNLFES